MSNISFEDYIESSSREESFGKEVKQSQHNTAINEERLIQLSEKLTLLLRQKQIFKDPLLKIDTLSRELKVPSYIVSQVLRFGLETNFNKLIGEYRTNYVKEKLQEPERSNAAILDIALEAGFNSKSSFNNTFKKITGLTPTQFRQKKVEENSKPPGQPLA